MQTNRYPYGIAEATRALDKITARLDDAEAGRVKLTEAEALDLAARSAQIKAQMTAVADDLRAIARDRLN